MRVPWSGSGRLPGPAAEQSSRALDICRRPRAQQRTPIVAAAALALALAASLADAISFHPAPAANLDLSQLGRIAVAGDFSGISLFQFAEQAEYAVNRDGRENLLAQLPNGALASVATTDASINAMCNFIRQDGTAAGLVIGGNFTSVQTVRAQAVALFDPATTAITAMPGLSGRVDALLCDRDTDTVYVGGNFITANSSNAIAWQSDTGWTNLPFAGFNGPVTSIAKASDGHIIFAGSFTGLGNASVPSTPDGQVINLSTANISATGSSSTAGFADPTNIVCSSGPAGPGSTWLLQDRSPGSWKAEFGYGFEPTKLRLWNTHQDGRGTKTWRFTALPLNGILNLTYTNPATGHNLSCTSECPLSDDAAVPFQDFHFVNRVGMNAFRIDISDFFGAGAGLDRIELFSNDILSYAIAAFGEPTCSGGAGTGTVGFPSTATATGPWTQSPSLQSSSDYLTANLTGTITPASASVVFFPDIKEAGNYSVNMYTPGCQQDATCTSRAQVNITGTMTAAAAGPDFAVSIFQTNNFDKYDQIYFGPVDPSSDQFRPSVTMTPLAGQAVDNMTFVAQRVAFTLVNSTGGLNGLFDYDPAAATDRPAVAGSAVDKLGAGFSPRSAVSALAVSADVLYVAGNFSSSAAKNIVSINTATKQVAGLDGGLDGPVLSMYLNETMLFVAGRFNGTLTPGAGGARLSNVAVYDTAANTFSALGGGVDGSVVRVAPMKISLDGGATNETVIAITGEFTHLLAFGSTAATDVSGFAIWVPSQANWLQNLNGSGAGGAAPGYNGVLSASVLDLPSGDVLYAGSLSSSQLGANDAATLTSDDGGGGLGRLGVSVLAVSNTSSRLAPAPGSALASASGSGGNNMSGVVAGAFHETAGRLMTILAGHFSARGPGPDPIQNIVILTDGGDGGGSAATVSGLGPGISDDSTFVTVAISGDTLYAGGQVAGTVGQSSVVGLVAYDLAAADFGAQPPSLSPANATVSALAVRASTGDVYVGGSFEDAGALSCPGLCFFSTSLQQWNRPGVNLGGTIEALMWANDSALVAGGSMLLSDAGTAPRNISLATFDPSSQSWSAYPGADVLPGAVMSITAGSDDGQQIWVSGVRGNGSTYVMKYDGGRWTTAPPLGAGTAIQSLQVFSLTQDHESSDLLAPSQVLMLAGHIVTPDSRTASAALFNGTTYLPFALTSSPSSSAGTISKIFTQHQNFFTSPGGGMPLGFIVLIGLAISLGLILLLTALGVLIDRIRKRREGYAPAPTWMQDRGNGMNRIPPHELLGGLGGKASSPAAHV